MPLWRADVCLLAWTVDTNFFVWQMSIGIYSPIAQIWRAGRWEKGFGIVFTNHRWSLQVCTASGCILPNSKWCIHVMQAGLEARESRGSHVLIIHVIPNWDIVLVYYPSWSTGRTTLSHISWELFTRTKFLRRPLHPSQVGYTVYVGSFLDCTWEPGVHDGRTTQVKSSARLRKTGEKVFVVE
jgi:hypothetical protein